MTIDLDVTPPSARPRPPGRAGRRLPLVLCLATALLLLGASTRADGPGVLRPVAAEGERVVAWVLSGDMLHSANVSENGLASIEVIGRSLDGNRLVWGRWIEGDGEVPILAEHGPHLVVTSAAAMTAVVLDRRTGAVVWESSGLEPVPRTPGGRLVLGEGGGLGTIDLRAAVPVRRPQGAPRGDVPADGLLLRAGRDRTAVRDRATGAFRGVLLGRAAPVRCAATGDHLACEVSKGQVVVWRLDDAG